MKDNNVYPIRPKGNYHLEDLDPQSLLLGINKHSYYGQDTLGNILLSEEDIFLAQKVCREGIEFTRQGYDISEDGFEDMEEVRTFLKDGLYSLDVLARLRNGADKAVQVHELFEQLEEQFPHLAARYQKIDIPEEIYEELKPVLDSDGHILDTASEKLSAIRKEMVMVRRSLYSDLSQLVKDLKQNERVPADMDLTIYNNRVVIPIYSEFKRNIRGYVHGQSGGGHVAYLEPPQAIEMNDRLFELYQAEEQEIEYLIKFYSSKFARSDEKLQVLQLTLLHMDLDRAKAKFLSNYRWSFPEVKQNSKINFENALHPELLLSGNSSQKEVIGNSIELDDKDRILLISGPNGGGKTIFMKTLGLLQTMAQAGLPIPAKEGSTTRPFSYFYFHSGDWQDVKTGESTYTGKLNFIKTLLEEKEPALFLIDEFGAGTESETGGALAEAILEEFSFKPLMGVLTTHLTNLKLAAENMTGVINGAMLFDNSAQRPSYRFKKGHYGSSMALQAAKLAGIPASILEKAKSKVGTAKVESEALLQKLVDRETKLEEEKASLEKELVKVADQKKRYEILLQDWEKQKKQRLTQANQEAEKLLIEANKRIEDTIRKIRESQAEKSITKSARKELDDYKAEIEKKVAPIQELPKQPLDLGPIQVGDYVKVDNSGAEGEVISLSGKEAEIIIGSLKSTVKLTRLSKVSKKKSKAKPVSSSNKVKQIFSKKSNFYNELDVRGLRTEEALMKVQDFLDNALMLGEERVSIIHGKGEGILKNMIRQHLKVQPQVASVHDGDPDRGGEGVTLVQLA